MSTKVLVAATKVEQWRRKCLNQCFACLSRGFPQQQRPSLLFFSGSIMRSILNVMWLYNTPAGWTYQLLNISVLVSSQHSIVIIWSWQGPRSSSPIQWPWVAIKTKTSIVANLQQQQQPCSTQMACSGSRKRVEIQVQKSLLLTATFLIMERAAQRHHGLQCRTEKDWSERDTHNGFDAHYRIVIFFPSAEKC